ncbi:hypothetical protein [Actinomadura latina]|uniref:Thiolase N-terminal domain-containing protein n=1 Tax=Actinomadura latina TaxID=163603 RepID=A0A846ZB60_9ACTN|nr:hypothetical protein [Actinomadura latina]NKZ07206.1 hypothetical protein [Actinomadura latina]CNG22345.1 Probable beta-ketoadipyl-CoA thiolase [Mycobacterium tuberculosis]
MNEVFVIDGARTPIGRYAGAPTSVRADDLAAIELNEAFASQTLPASACSTWTSGKVMK